MKISDRCRQVVDLANEAASAVQYSESEITAEFYYDTKPVRIAATVYVSLTENSFTVSVNECPDAFVLSKYTDALVSARDYCLLIGKMLFRPSKE